MDRRAEVTKLITKEQRGIELGPWFAPLAPKKEGYNSLSLDIFDADTLRQRATDDPHVPRGLIPNIEQVDLVGSSTEIEGIVSKEGLLGRIDYIISSHNFEHLPDPVLFLQGCGRVLTSSGTLSMAIPDKRTCFDHFRPHTALDGWLEAHFDHRTKPTYAQVFGQRTLAAVYMRDSQQHPGFSLGDDTGNLAVAEELLEQLEEWKRKINTQDQAYQDAHCWTFTPSSFALLIHDLRFLGLCPLEIEEVSEANGHEFYVHLRNRGYSSAGADARAHYERRQELLRRISNEVAWNTPYGLELRKENERLKIEISEAKIAYAHKCDSARVIEQKLREQEIRINELQSRIAVEFDCSRELERKNNELESRVADLVASTSWRITAPLRALSIAARRRRQL